MNIRAILGSTGEFLVSLFFALGIPLFVSTSSTRTGALVVGLFLGCAILMVAATMTRSGKAAATYKAEDGSKLDLTLYVLYWAGYVGVYLVDTWTGLLTVFALFMVGSIGTTITAVRIRTELFRNNLLRTAGVIAVWLYALTVAVRVGPEPAACVVLVALGAIWLVKTIGTPFLISKASAVAARA